MISSIIKLCNQVSCYDGVSLQIKRPIVNFFEIYIDIPTSDGSHSVSFRMVDNDEERTEAIMQLDNALGWLKKFAHPSLLELEYDFRLFIYLVTTIDSFLITDILLDRTINGNYFIRVKYDGDEDYGFSTSNYTNEGITKTCNFLLSSHFKKKKQKSVKK